MTLEDLRVFTAVCEAHNLSTVARALGCTQPAVAQHVTRLERELKVALLERTGRGVIPTPAGRLLYAGSAAGLDAVGMAVREIQRLRDGEAGRLAIATGGTTVRHFLRDAVIRFRKRYADVTLHFEPGSSTEQCLEAIVRRRSDMAFVTIGATVNGFEQRPVMENPLLLLVRSGHSLERRRSVRVRDLEQIRYIALPESTSSHRFVSEALAREGVRLTATARVDDFDTANLFVELGLGQAIVPAVQAWSFARNSKVRALPIAGLPPIAVGWAARSFQLLPPVAREFMDIFRDSAAQWRAIPGVKLID